MVIAVTPRDSHHTWHLLLRYDEDRFRRDEEAVVGTLAGDEPSALKIIECPCHGLT